MQYYLIHLKQTSKPIIHNSRTCMQLKYRVHVQIFLDNYSNKKARPPIKKFVDVCDGEYSNGSHLTIIKRKSVKLSTAQFEDSLCICIGVKSVIILRVYIRCKEIMQEHYPCFTSNTQHNTDQNHTCSPLCITLNEVLQLLFK